MGNAWGDVTCGKCCCCSDDPEMSPLINEDVLSQQQRYPNHGRVCVVCLERPRCIRLPCGHEALCAFCAGALQHRGEGCPLCRQPFPEYKIGNYGRYTFKARHHSKGSQSSYEDYQAADFTVQAAAEGKGVSSLSPPLSPSVADLPKASLVDILAAGLANTSSNVPTADVVAVEQSPHAGTPVAVDSAAVDSAVVAAGVDVVMDTRELVVNDDVFPIDGTPETVDTTVPTKKEQ
eukprot:TRINITY_DN14170_c0_g1_i1.p1 TRINITY_DN14170_c0_g1~~TRINITY_DN14170_c0_g1_i1.p1  ORF type:complete len:234 (-),score=32.76 TRINITY_DN14170_c0_g1_i1:113-814(-)